MKLLMRHITKCQGIVPALLTAIAVSAHAPAQDVLPRVAYNGGTATADLGVGLWAWPLPIDYDLDGDYDLVVSCPDTPFRGTWFFENPGDDPQLPTFLPAVQIGPAQPNVQIAYTGGDEFRVLSPNTEYLNFRTSVYEDVRELGLTAKIDPAFERYRANQWKSADIDADGDQDLIIGIEIWDDYGWDDAWNEAGEWINGPLHGYVYIALNEGSDAEPRYADAVPLTAGGERIDVFGMPSPSFADYDRDGDLDLICGEFLDGFTYFENVGDASEWELAAGRRLDVHMDLQMIVPTAIDWDRDGDPDLICGDEDGRVAFLENRGVEDDGLPMFSSPDYFRQQAADVKFGALVTPSSADIDGDGDEDLICGNTAGYIGFIENLGGGAEPRWAEPRRIELQIHARERDDLFLRHQAGPNGSIQGPCEAKWGYTSPCAADWDHDGLVDLIVNDIWGKVVWYRNIGAASEPAFQVAEPMRVKWEGDTPKPEWTWWTPEPGTLVTQWRTTPVVVDWTGDGLNDLVMLDHEGYLALYERSRADDGLVLQPPQRCFSMTGLCEYDSHHRPAGLATNGLLRLNANRAGASGRRKLCCCDWDGDGDLDLIINSTSANVLINTGRREDGQWWFEDTGPVSDHILAGHSTSPTVCDWNEDGVLDLLIGAEDGYLYLLRRDSQ
jgi:hypothetical protein